MATNTARRVRDAVGPMINVAIPIGIAGAATPAADTAPVTTTATVIPTPAADTAPAPMAAAAGAPPAPPARTPLSTTALPTATTSCAGC